jgi:hypothetical protein
LAFSFGSTYKGKTHTIKYSIVMLHNAVRDTRIGSTLVEWCCSWSRWHNFASVYVYLHTHVCM